MKILNKVYYSLYKFNKEFKIYNNCNEILITINSQNNNKHYICSFVRKRSVHIPTPTIINLEDFSKIDIIINMVNNICEKIK